MSAEDRPNIIFLFTDDLAYSALGISGNEQVKTPNLDRLGRDGVIFERHYNSSAICMASRANVMSGLYEYKTGCNFMHGSMGTKEWETSYPILLKESGYRIGFAGKFGFSISDVRNVDQRGTDGFYAAPFFDDWKGGRVQTSYNTAKNKPMVEYAKKYPHATRSYAAATIDFVKDSIEAGKPFCMSLFFKAPHSPLDPDPMFDDVYKDTVWKTPENFGQEGSSHLSGQAREGRQQTYFARYFDTEEKYQDYLRRYHQLVYGVDYAVGMIRDGLEELGVADNTVIIFSSDNGSFLGAHGFGGKVLPYEEAAHVPTFIYDPRLPDSTKGERTESLSANVDIAATILDLAGVDIPKFYDGISLMPLMEDASAEVRSTVPIIQVWGEEETRSLSIVSKDFKYINWYYEDSKKGLKPSEELYRVTEDTMELDDLSKNPEYASVLNRMRELYDSRVKVWAEESVEYNGYSEYGKLFDRTIAWQEKAELIKEKDSKLIGQTGANGKRVIPKKN
ncbi:sulfatase-like hydrolase/transferase [Pelagicoccus mobilis]|uniref:sulfatase-like hydrolase/transferase n=1 Tax=Pelagicoccus mobilis TaxID=415221 RepID=UPI0019041FB3|nr:sulfatase-like hydrolase/transferase [Pelagicoccus mobilis]